jgi:NADPH:quinone reductase
MRAIRVPEPGGPDSMQITELPSRALEAGEVRVRVEAAGVNFIDVYHRSGQYKEPLPVAIGREGAGVVEEVSPSVSGLAKGDRVAWAGVPGSYATEIITTASKLVPVPPSIDSAIAAASMLQGMTAQYLTASTFALAPGHICLVHAAAGGVGLLLCQLAKRRGARVIGTVSTREKADRAKRAGADEVILYTEDDFETEVARLTNGEKVHVVYDSVGKTTFEKSLRCLRLRGTMVLFGQSSGPVGAVDPQLLNKHGSLYLTRPALHHYTHTREELVERASDVFRAIEEKKLAIAVHARMTLDRAADAHRMLESRATSGKILLIP